MFSFLRKATASPPAAPAGPLYAMCERVTATPMSPHHVRELTEVGMKQGGGADSLALCGAEVAWDTRGTTLEDMLVAVPHQHENYKYCVGCVAAAEKLVAEASQ